MKFKWGMKKLTFVIIPENAQRAVVKLRFTHAVLYAAALLLIGLIGWTLAMQSLHLRSELVNERLKADLNDKMQHYDQIVADKNEMIEKLQNEVVLLSEQAKEVKTQMEEVMKLEKDLRSITGGASAPVKEPVAAKGTDDQESAVVQGETGLGGIMIPVEATEILKLSDDTSAEFEGLSEQAGELKNHLAAAREELQRKQRLWRITPNIWPVESRNVTSSFGYRKDPFNNRLSFHSGMDIAAPVNTEVVVTADGTVVSAGYDSGKGNFIIVDHTGGIRTSYMHLNQILVSEGDKVAKGDRIGKVGSTGRSTGAHLHYEVIKQGQSIDPRPYLK
ncbi:M23 family metallopeptidase [Paenibacillus naphthalenovorans]|uniref:Peptidase M23 n=1 Tax=Paenibacillus naphthalenovorans TaxID=162209 RepID=A0A0U2WD36_9BACL|nr:M23 family metallopeptidase [Paenibacillus naphthalenovorans]ALS25341.1 peptidase M23 [Paenibacillus naphthalenovorans]